MTKKQTASLLHRLWRVKVVVIKNLTEERVKFYLWSDLGEADLAQNKSRVSNRISDVLTH